MGEGAGRREGGRIGELGLVYNGSAAFFRLSEQL